MKEFTVNKNDAGQRMDKFLTKAVPRLPNSLIYKYIRLKRIKLNGKRCEISTRLTEDDVIQLYINDEFFDDDSTTGPDFLAAPKLTDIVYEDDDILLVNKKSGLVVHEDDRGSSDTLIKRILRYLYDKGEYLPDRENSFVPALCNRIDRNTSGIVICAKNAESLRILNQKVKDRELEKKYLCVTVGIPKIKEAELRAYHIKDERENLVRIINKPTKDSKTIITRYKVVAEDAERDLALVEVELVTGRTHQIRAHLAFEGYPLLGDGKYGINRINRQYNVKTQALCAYSLGFRFTTEAGALEHLNGRTFTIKDVWFKKLFYQHT